MAHLCHTNYQSPVVSPPERHWKRGNRDAGIEGGYRGGGRERGVMEEVVMASIWVWGGLRKGE